MDVKRVVTVLWCRGVLKIAGSVLGGCDRGQSAAVAAPRYTTKGLIELWVKSSNIRNLAANHQREHTLPSDNCKLLLEEQQDW
jgi:hypothetical protein